jgi:hypothetical protein
MRILFFHGLESQLPSKKVDWLVEQGYEVLAHPMLYHKNNALIIAIEEAKKYDPHIIIGSSMGGHFALIVATYVETDIILLNPATHSRSVEYPFPSGGTLKPNIWALIGMQDQVIEPVKSVILLKEMNANITVCNHSHRTPLEVFIPYIENVLKEVKCKKINND